MDIFLAILGSSAFAALVGSVTTYFIEKARRKEDKNDLLLFLTASQLTILGQNVIKDGSIDFETLKLYSNMYDRYKETKGANGYIDLLFSKVKGLPVNED